MKTLEELNREWVNEPKTEYLKTAKRMEIMSKQTESAPKQTESTSKPAKAPAPPSVWNDLVSLLIKISLIAITITLSLTFLFGIVRFQEPSMDPTIKDGDLVLFYRYNHSGYVPQDVIVLNHDGERQVSRVIATAGDTVDITEDGLFINGALQQEGEIFQKTERFENEVVFPLTVPEEQVFVLGDGRQDAIDSRVYGCVNIDDTLGKVMTIIRRRIT